MKDEGTYVYRAARSGLMVYSSAPPVHSIVDHCTLIHFAWSYSFTARRLVRGLRAMMRGED